MHFRLFHHGSHDNGTAPIYTMSGLSPNQEVQDCPEYGLLREYLSTDTTTLDDALDVFCRSVEDQFMKTCNPSDVHELLWRAWRAVVAVAAEVPHNSDARQKLVDFILRLRTRPDLEKQDQTCKVWDAVVWRGLPIFGVEMREAWNHAATDSSSPTHQQQWLNLNAFAASLLSAVHATSNPDPDLSLYGLWTIRSGLENNDETPSSISVQAVAMWFVYAAPAIWDLCKQEKSYEGKVARAGDRYAASEWTGYSIGRWHSWKDGFAELHRAGLHDGAAAYAERAIQIMTSVGR